MIEPLEYNLGLNAEEAREKYNEVKQAFEEIKSHYSRFLIWLKRKISDEDKKTLTDCIGVLFPLSIEPKVYEEEPQLIREITHLNWNIMKYLARFKNTGVEMLGNGSVM